MNGYWLTREIPLEADSPLAVFFEKLDEELIRIHLTNCFSSGIIDSKTIEIVNHFKSYTEYNAEGTGVTILVMGRLPFIGETEGMSEFKYTGRIIVYDRIIENQEAIDWFISKYALNFGEHYDVPYERMLPLYPEVTLDGYSLKTKGGEIRKGTRHQKLLSYGGKLLSDGMDMDMVEIKMYDLNMLYCAPPLSAEEFRGIVNSVSKYVRKGEE